MSNKKKRKKKSTPKAAKHKPIVFSILLSRITLEPLTL